MINEFNLIKCRLVTGNEKKNIGKIKQFMYNIFSFWNSQVEIKTKLNETSYIQQWTIVWSRTAFYKLKIGQESTVNLVYITQILITISSKQVKL